jgi:DNA primase catalytic core
MARIPDAELERLKRELSVLARVKAAGVELRRHGANWLGRCPFHDDRTPSLVVTPAKNLWHCLGACQRGGSVIDWVMRVERVSFRRAVELLRGETDALAPTLTLTPDADDAALMSQVAAYYHATLLGSEASPEALAYLAKRGLDDRALIDRFQLGYANRTLAYYLPAKVLKAGAALRGRLQALGLVRGSGHEHFTGSIVVPIRDERGHVVEVYGRKIRDDLREGTPVHCYLPGPLRGVWNLDGLLDGLRGAPEVKDVILCEALIDALSFWRAGYHHVTSSYGVNGFTADHRTAFARLRARGLERVLIAYDRDDAGDRGAAAMATELAALGLRCYRVHFPLGLDANAVAVTMPPAAESLGRALRHATWMGEAGAGAASIAIESANAEPSHATASSLAAAGAVTPLVSPEPQSPPSADPPLDVRDSEVLFTREERVYRVRGLAKNLSADALRVNVLVKLGAAVHVDTLDLYAARPRTLFTAQAATELQVSEDVIKQDLGALLLELERVVDQQLRAALAPKDAPTKAPPMTDGERAAALALLRAPNLLERILADFERAGVVGEETNKLVGYLAALSRKLPEPLAVIIQSASAAGKTSLMDAVLALVPPEERVQYSAMTSQALFYMAETNLKHKVLAVVEEEGAERASYALKLLQSEGELTIASTGKDPETGKLVTHEYRVEGPVMIMLTTTAVELDEELVNRALVLTVDETQAQTKAIHQRQRARRTLEGQLQRAAKSELLALHRNAQRLIEPLTVVNPYAPELTFIDGQTRTRRDHEKYLTLIDVVALLHQHQRERKMARQGETTIAYIEVTPEDIAIANRLAAAVLGRTLDELPPQTRSFLERLDAWVTTTCRARRCDRTALHFLTREARDATGAGVTQTKVHLRRLVDLEYVLVHRAPRGQGVAYELVYQRAADERVAAGTFSGLRDVGDLATLVPTYDDARAARNTERSGVGRPPVGAEPGGGRAASMAPIVRDDRELAHAVSVRARNHRNGAAPVEPALGSHVR